MSQTAEKAQSCYPLFEQEEYQTLFHNKRPLEEAHDEQRVREVFEWTTTQAYQELNFKREALTIDPAKACQPLGSVLCSLGFANTLPYVHGSQGCVAYFRTYFNRHFKEPIACVSDSMTEDAAVFGGNNNLNAGLENASALYKPEVIAVSTTCMAEVIGDDLQAFIANAKKDGFVDADMPIPYAHTPSFIGSHITGWDNMFEGFARTFTVGEDKHYQPGSLPRLNLVTGFETYLGNYRVLKRMMADMGVPCAILSDPSEVLDTPADGHYRMYAGGTTQQEMRDAPNAIDTLLLQPWHLIKTKKMVQDVWNQPATEVSVPIGLNATDKLLMTISALTDVPIGEALTLERGRLVDMMLDSHTWLHGKRFGLYGDPDFVMGLTQFLLELGCEPTVILCHNGNKRWQKAMKKILEASPYGQESDVYINSDLWHFRSLMFTKQPDFMIGNSYGKFIQRDTLAKGEQFEVPLIRLGFPLFDRHHLHRQTTWGYEGAMSILTSLVNAVLEKLDRDTMKLGKTDYGFDLVR
ncbi:nitrogenase molybdenum-iron protein beta chain [Pectobacterium atrosepticum SCRI1043]|uniref:Nitrogenase molybdenum-iron protein beta chain n=1 Tax=Pectobacterium atrosepticum (strain SCRI 1043 / ATCC BAA-672) TaxID=218491 RepID=Q6D2Z0_PECAS|nr:nitrogenase molybdenum-iron protein subunit beta [Pectobacterium atrosepticum]GKV84275.1 nitrogenase molybdenum-iron protein beta chain [Pectobacterium carotovorum subsp. carotovorum]ATY91473.1 nitrogenase molybdenum-iron protein subunit beta [Pectobacterium atrosepticum]KFX17590.1 nitrogenase molybdenum-iron protein subunit beta [Pectobacterium atrosepticum]KFX26245.1 nitrogenase molybdenum-iron protein subunit beta [Pectobacterium atrosepticum]KMK88600.1 nitrogenase molybdenum-iron protei